MSKLRIIIADDHGMVRRGVRTLIESRSEWELCAEADNGRQALELARRLKPDVAVLDFSMPELNGLEVTRRVRRASPATRVLMLSMHDSESLAREIQEAGGMGYLLKRDTPELLLQAIDTIAKGNPYWTTQLSGNHTTHSLTARKDLNPRGRITPREREIIQLLADGKANKEIADRLDIAMGTVESHRKNIMSKLRLHSRIELVRYAIRNRLTEA